MSKKTIEFTCTSANYSVCNLPINKVVELVAASKKLNGVCTEIMPNSDDKECFGMEVKLPPNTLEALQSRFIEIIEDVEK